MPEYTGEVVAAGPQPYDGPVVQGPQEYTGPVVGAPAAPAVKLPRPGFRALEMVLGNTFAPFEAISRMALSMAGQTAGAAVGGVESLFRKDQPAGDTVRQRMEAGGERILAEPYRWFGETPKDTLAATPGLEEKMTEIFHAIRDTLGTGMEGIEKARGAVAEKIHPALRARPEAARTLGEYAFDAPAAVAPLSVAGKLATRSRQAPAPQPTPPEPIAAPPVEPQGPPRTGTSSGVPIKLDRLIAEAQRNAEPIEAPPIKGVIRQAAQEGRVQPQQGATGIDRTVDRARQETEGLAEPPSVKSIIKGIKDQPSYLRQGLLDEAGPRNEALGRGGSLDEPPTEKAPRGTSEKLPFEAEPYRPFNVDKEYPVRPMTIPRSEVRGDRSGGTDRKVYEVVHFNTPFERTLADAGRNWQVEGTQAAAREKLNAAIRQMSEEDAGRFGAFRDMPPEQAMEAAKQYFDQIRSWLFEARKAKLGSHSVQIEAPDAERMQRFGREEPPPDDMIGRSDESPGPPGEIAPPPAPAAEPKPAARKATAQTSLLHDIKQMGGIDPALAEDIGGERGFRASEGSGRGLFKKGGAGMDDLATRLRDRGYNIPDDPVDGGVQALRDMVRDELEGRQKHYSGFKEEDAFAAERERRYGPESGLSMNPMMNPRMVKDFLDKSIKKGLGWANALQSAPESAKGAIAPLIEYARDVQAAKEIAQRDVMDPVKNKAAIEADHAKALDQVLRANPRFQVRTPKDAKSMAAETERMQLEIAAIKMQRRLREEGYAVKGFEEAPEKGEPFREPKLNMADMKDRQTGRLLRVRDDVQKMVDQVVGAHDIGEQRTYGKSFWGGLEAVNHAAVGWLMQNPIFHMVTTAGKAAVYTVPTPTRSSLANYWSSATEAINNRETLRDMVKHGFQPFPLRAKMEPTGAEPGVIEKLMSESKASKTAYDVYQKFHNRILADTVNKIQAAFYQMRLEQLVKQAQSRGEKVTPQTMDTFKLTAAQESNPIGGNLPREEMNRTLYRALGNTLFSRGLQASTIRMLTRTIENNEIVRSYAESKGFTPEEAKTLTDRNRNFLMAALALDYALMQTVANGINYTTTAMYDEPDKEGNKGGHFVWENAGAKPADKLFPTRIFLYPKSKDGKNTGEGVYIGNPIRTVRDIIEYGMIPFQIGGGTKPQVLENKASVTAHLAKGALSGSDWAGRPLSGPGDVLAESASLLAPAPAGDLPRYAMEAARTGNASFLSEGVKKIFDPETALPVILGLQPSVSSTDPAVTRAAGEQTKEEKKLWGRVARVKQLSRGMDEKVRNEEADAIVDKAREIGMDPRSIKAISTYLRTEGVTRSQQRKAGAYERVQQGEIAPPPAGVY